MRKFINYIILLLCFLFTTNIVYANDIKKAYYTDVTAYINGLPIPCYEIDGKIAIIAEDLQNYGFDVKYGFKSTWQGKKPLLEITYQREKINCNTLESSKENDINDRNNISFSEQFVVSYGKEITANNTEQNKKTPGSVAFYLYQTNLCTIIYLDKNEIPCYSIGEKTMIFLDSLKMPDSYFTNAYENNTNIIYHAEEKKVYFQYIPNWSICLTDGNYGNYKNEKTDISHLSLTLNKNEQGNFDVINENMQYLDGNMTLNYYRSSGLQLSIDFLYDNTLPPNQVNYLFPAFSLLATSSADGLFDDKNAHFTNEHLKLYINGKKLNITSGFRAPGNNHTLYTFYFDEAEIDFNKIQTLKLECL